MNEDIENIINSIQKTVKSVHETIIRFILREPCDSNLVKGMLCGMDDTLEFSYLHYCVSAMLKEQHINEVSFIKKIIMNEHEFVQSLTHDSRKTLLVFCINMVMEKEASNDVIQLLAAYNKNIFSKHDIIDKMCDDLIGCNGLNHLAIVNKYCAQAKKVIVDIMAAQYSLEGSMYGARALIGQSGYYSMQFNVAINDMKQMQMFHMTMASFYVDILTMLVD